MVTKQGGSRSPTPAKNPLRRAPRCGMMRAGYGRKAMETLALILAALSASAALAEQQEQRQQQTIIVRAAPVRYNPNEIVCRRWTETGSRLRTQRACATRADWAELLRHQRQNIERVQTNRTM